MAISIEADVSVRDFGRALDGLTRRQLKDACEDLSDRTKGWLREEVGSAPSPGIKADFEDWEAVERALLANDRELIDRWLWMQIRERWAKPKFVPLVREAVHA